MRYRLRTLLILLAVGASLLACGWSNYKDWQAIKAWQEEVREAARRAQETGRFDRMSKNPDF